jgi:hypothetical protein
MHFSDKLSYKILCFLSYRLKDTNFARLTHLQEFQKKNRGHAEAFLTEQDLARENDERATGELTGLLRWSSLRWLRK